MEGSLDLPPVVIRTSRFVSWAGVSICGSLLSVGIWHLFHPVAAWSIESYFVLAVFGFAGSYFAMQIVNPSTLILAPSGLTWNAPLGSRHWRWRDLDNFRAGALGAVACDISDRDSRFAWLRPINKAVAGSSGAFGFGWEGGVATVTAMLIEARARWV